MHLAYIKTGVPAVDAESRAGLIGLGKVLNRRTAVEAASRWRSIPRHDELMFFPLLYWPVVAGQPALVAAGGRAPQPIPRDRRHDLFRHAGPGRRQRRHVADETQRAPAPARGRARDSALEPVPPDHVLTKSFYLMQEFPGRWAGGQLWVEPAEDRVNDGVASVIIGSNDYAGAWAVDSKGRPAYAVVPGGEQQREMAYRFGVNLVMYALTGNYKSDQVHVPAILERLGQ